MVFLAELTVEQSVLLAGSATFALSYVRKLVRIRYWRRNDVIRRERAARKVVTLDFLDEEALDGLADHLVIADPPERLRRIELEHVAADERSEASVQPRARMLCCRDDDARAS
jgi:hypothetical protein